MSALYIGLMSGTSQNGVDAVVAEFEGQRFGRLVATNTVYYPAAVRRRLLALARNEHPLTLRDYCDLDQAVARSFAQAARAVLKKKNIPVRRIKAIGSHGQTVFHAATGPVRSSVQLGDPNLIAALADIATVADFRRADMAAGGQGAPLVPAFHHALFAAKHEARAVVNIGGIANITILPNDLLARVSGFDTGPGNALMDEWVQHHHRREHDDGGRWAATGRLDKKLLSALLNDRYFRQKPPKSSGRGYFNLDWARRRHPALNRMNPAAVQNTFTELTALTIADAIRRHAPRTRRVLVCGGGVHNGFLMRRLSAQLAPRQVEITNAYGLDAQWVEAAAFAWLAMRTVNGLPGNVPAVTGARAPVILGGIYRA
jgi:anhydro-N-acetylmuramic acid kinase